MKPKIVRCKTPTGKPTPIAEIKKHLSRIRPSDLSLQVIDFFDPVLFGDGSVEPIGPKAAVKQFARIVGLKEKLSFRRAK